MAVYLSVILSTSLISLFFKRTKGIMKHLVFLCSVFVPSCLSSLRQVGTDYFIYQDRYNKIAFDIHDKEIDNSIIYTIMNLIHDLGGNYQIFVSIVSFITTFIAFYIIYYLCPEIDCTLSVFTYLTVLYLTSYNIFRQILATEIMLLGIILFLKHKKRGLIYIFLSCIVHSSMLFTLFFFALFLFITLHENRFEESGKKSFYIVYTGLGALIVSLPVISSIILRFISIFSHYGYYLTNFMYQPIGLSLLPYCFILISAYIFLSTDKFNRVENYILYSSTIGTILWCLAFVSTSSSYRLSYNLFSSLPLLVGLTGRKTGRYKYLYLISILLLLTMYVLYYFGIKKSGEIVPYSFVSI